MGVKVELDIQQKLEQALSVLDDQKNINMDLENRETGFKVMIEHFLSLMDIDNPLKKEVCDHTREMILKDIHELHDEWSNDAAIVLKNYTDRYSEIVLHKAAISNMESDDGNA